MLRKIVLNLNSCLLRNRSRFLKIHACSLCSTNSDDTVVGKVTQVRYNPLESFRIQQNYNSSNSSFNKILDRWGNRKIAGSEGEIMWRRICRKPENLPENTEGNQRLQSSANVTAARCSGQNYSGFQETWSWIYWHSRFWIKGKDSYSSKFNILIHCLF